MHRHHDIRATHKLLVDVQLRYRGPFRVLLDSCIDHQPWFVLVHTCCPGWLSRSCIHSPALNSSSSKTLNAVNFSGLTPCRPRIWMLALEKPHCGVSGVPFINSTTGAEATALSIACRVSVDRNDFWSWAKRGERSGLRRGRRACPATCIYCEWWYLILNRT